MVEWLAGNRLRGTTAERPNLGLPSGSVGGWVELGRITAGSEVDKLLVNTIADKRYLMVLGDLDPNGSTNAIFRYNEDTGSNYAWRYSENGGADGTDTSRNLGIIHSNSYTTPFFNVNYISNLSSKEKLWITHGVEQSTAGAGTAPTRSESVGKWVNTSDAIDDVEITNTTVGGYKTGSECVVLGWDPDDTHTTNFWEELASVEGTGITTLDSGTFTAKKYLWVQVFLAPDATYNPQFEINSDTGNNYSYRFNDNGGADGTSTSQNHLLVGNADDVPQFSNFFIINNSANEKLFIGNTTQGNSAGAGNAPTRREIAQKWINTSSQITQIKIKPASGSPNLTSNSIIKVWGAD